MTRFLEKEAFADLAENEVITPRFHVSRSNGASTDRVLKTEGWDRAVLKPVNVNRHYLEPLIGTGVPH